MLEEIYDQHELVDPFPEPQEVDPLDPGDLPVGLIGAVICGRLPVERLQPHFATGRRHQAVIRALRGAAAAGDALDVTSTLQHLHRTGELVLWANELDYIQWYIYVEPTQSSLTLDVEAALAHVRELAALREVRTRALEAGAATEVHDLARAERALCDALAALRALRPVREELAA